MIKAENFEEFEAAAQLNPMSFNLFYAGKDQKIKFWHIGKYQDRSDNVDPRLPHDGRGDEEWGGFIPFADLPQAADPAQGFFVNWNNKPASWWNHGDNVPWRPRSELRSQTNRVIVMKDFVEPINQFSYANLKDVPKQINSHGTYQQAIEITSTGFIDENIIPPGQSGFVNLEGVKSPHFDDQWDMHTNWRFKDMEFGEPTVAVESRSDAPSEFSLSQNYPNPFNPITTIKYQLSKPAFVKLRIYDINGKLVETLVKAYQTVGSHQVQWNAKGFGSGAYFYQITAGEYSSVRKSIVLK